MKKRTPSASISFSGAIGSSPGAELGVDDREGLIQEASGCVVVVHRHPCAGDEVVRRGDIQDGDRLATMRLVEDADLDGERIRLRMRAPKTAHERTAVRISAQSAFNQCTIEFPRTRRQSRPRASAAATRRSNLRRMGRCGNRVDRSTQRSLGRSMKTITAFVFLLGFFTTTTGSFAAEKPPQFWNLTTSTVTSLQISKAGENAFQANQTVNDPDGTGRARRTTEDYRRRKRRL